MYFSVFYAHYEVTMNTNSTKSTDFDPIEVVPEVLPMEDSTNTSSTKNSSQACSNDAKYHAYTNASAQKTDPDITQKVKGAAQMAAGAALGAAGIPMLILPGPGAFALVGGAALMSKGQRNFSGREATAVEEKIDEAAAKLGDAAKEKTKQTAHKAAKKAPEVALEAAKKAPVVAKIVVDEAPVIAKKVTKKTARVAGPVVKEASQSARKATKKAAHSIFSK